MSTTAVKIWKMLSRYTGRDFGGDFDIDIDNHRN